MKFNQSVLAGMALLLASASALAQVPSVEVIYQFDKTQSIANNAQFYLSSAGRMYGVNGAAAFPTHPLWSVKIDGSDFAVVENPGIIGTPPGPIETLRGTSGFAEDVSGLLYKGSIPNLDTGRFGTTCPYTRTVRVDDTPVSLTDYGFIWRFGPGLAPEKLPVSQTVPICPTGTMAADSTGNVYFTSRIASGPAEVQGTAIYRLSEGGAKLAEVYRFGDVDVPANAEPVYLALSQDGLYLYGIIASSASEASYIYRVGVDGSGFLRFPGFEVDADFLVAANAPSLIEVGDYLYGGARKPDSTAWGSVYRIKKDGSQSPRVLHQFTDADGRNPVGRLALGGDGNIYGVTSNGGSAGNGTIYRIRPAAITETEGGVEGNLHQFSAAVDGQAPTGLVAFRNGKLYGTVNNTAGGLVYALDIGYVPPSPVIAFSAQPAEVAWVVSAQGQSTLTWSVENAGTCVASGDWSGAKSLNGSEVVTPVREGDNTYTLDCDNGSGLETAIASKSIVVRAVVPPPPVSVGSFTVTPASVDVGATYTLNWTTTNASSCNIMSTGATIYAVPSASLSGGSYSLSRDAAGSVSYTLSCSGLAGDAVESPPVSVAVNAIVTEVGSGGGGSVDWLTLALLGAMAGAMRRRFADALA